MNKILVEVSVGELFDKISILEIKKDRINRGTSIGCIFAPVTLFVLCCKKRGPYINPLLLDLDGFSL